MTRLEAALAELAAAIREEVADAAAAGSARPPELLSIEEACRRASIGRSLLMNLIGRGELRSVKVGRRRLIPADALAELAGEARDAG